MMHCASGFADDLLIDDFSDDASSRWEFIADGVMGARWTLDPEMKVRILLRKPVLYL